MYIHFYETRCTFCQFIVQAIFSEKTAVWLSLDQIFYVNHLQKRSMAWQSGRQYQSLYSLFTACPSVIGDRRAWKYICFT